jgi:D-sedoheptulose 7-phosphate isomerase
MALKNYFKIYTNLFKIINTDEVNKVIDVLSKFDRNKKVYIIGNGGSAALAEHFAQDLSKKCFIPAISLTNICNITAFGNDVGYNFVFDHQLDIYGNPGDLLICFSSSGTSTNISRSCLKAKNIGLTVISFTGFDGGFTKNNSDFNIHIPMNDYGVIESIHSILMHFITDVLYDLQLKEEKDV